MPRNNQTQPGMIAYRLDLLEIAVKDIGESLRGINHNLKALATLEERHAEVQASVQRAFDRVEKIENKQSVLDDEFKKWFNRGTGIAMLATVVWAVAGWAMVTKVTDIAGAAEKVVELERKIKRNARVIAVLSKKLGYEFDFVDNQ